MPSPVLLKPAATLSLSLALALVLLAGAGCGEDEPEADPSPTASDTASPSASPTTSPSPTDASSPADPELPFPDSEPAAGPVTLRERSVEVTVPEGWIATEEVLSFGSGSNGGPGELILLSDQEAFGLDLEPPTLDQQAKIALESARALGGSYQREPDVELGGVPLVRISGTTEAGRHFEQVTAHHEDRLISLTFEVSPATLRQQPDLVESVLNTWRWR
ncbi:hypothetical protein [Nocardioides dongkuii]|uniref:hypothetical protein n=1 Tax=Nocardioides dongkuii TaxID=2760089 RepID=UPI001877CCB6|nr:hypothetical protein [Nocardioides dongkuii]